MTISEYLLSFARKEMPKSRPKGRKGREPNEETKKALRDSRSGKGETFDSVEDFWKAMGMTPHVKH